MTQTNKPQLTEEQYKIKLWGEQHNAKLREEVKAQELPTAQELLNEVK